MSFTTSCLLLFIMSNTQENLPLTEPFKRLDTVLAQCGGANSLQQSVAITAFFKDLSLRMAWTLPNKLGHYLDLPDTAARVARIQTVMTVILDMTDKVDMVDFLHTYIPKLSPATKQHSALINYLGDAKALQADLERATHLDIKDMMSAIKKGVLKRLYELVQRSQSEALDVDDSCRPIKEKLTSYEWICQLTHVQEKVSQLLKIGEGRLTPPELVELNRFIGADQSSEAHTSIDDVLALLRHYGMYTVEVGQKNHRVVTVKAANLSLKDILKDPKLLPSDEIRFLCTDGFYLDASMDASANATWASKNIAIKAPRIHVKTDDCGINLSGTDGVDGAVVAGGKYKADDGKISGDYGPGDHGSHGEHGTPGKSGGNIFICADEIINSEQLTLRSCGGKGGNGQDGGDGRNGKAKPSASDDLSSWPNNFARFAGSSTAQKDVIKKMCRSDYCDQKYVQESKGKLLPVELLPAGVGAPLLLPSSFLLHWEIPAKMGNYVYGKAPNGVKILFSTAPYLAYRYGFLFSKSKDGVSADGGNAGTGGFGGGGGQAGVISITRLDGRPYKSDNHMNTARYRGQDGRPGKTGKPGERSIADREKDSLCVDGAGPWGTSNIYHGFIDVKPWNRSSKTGQLGSGKYYCRHEVIEVSRLLDLVYPIDIDHIGFFRSDKKISYCLTERNRQAVRGKANDQHHITATTKTKPIDQAAININYQLFASETLVLQDRTTLLQSLEQLEHVLHEELQELETIHEKQHHKQVRHVKHTSGDNWVDDADIKLVSKGIIAEAAIPFEPDKLIHVVDGNPWISQDDITFFQSNAVTIDHKYGRIREIIQNQLDALQQRMGDELDKETTLIDAWLKEKWKSLSLTDSDYVCRMLDAIFVPIVRGMRFEHTHAIDDTIRFLTAVRERSHSHFRSQMNAIKATINPLLFKQYRWCKLAEIHDKLIDTIPCADPAFQSKSVAVYMNLQQQKSIEEFNAFASKLSSDNECEINPYNESCDTMMPLSQSTQKALELLMVFINESNTGSVYVPDILSAVQEEYATFHFTINDSDLLFIMTYLQDKLTHLMDKTLLEDLFCDTVLSKVNDQTFKGYIIYNGKTYRIDTVIKHSSHQFSITMRYKVSNETWAEWLKEETLHLKAEVHHLQIHALDQVTLDDTPVAFPDALLVSPIDIEEVWHQLQHHQIVLKDGWVPDDIVLETQLDTLSLPDGAHGDCKDKLIMILRQAREAQDIPYDVFSFFPPSQWVEQLILYQVRRHYQDHAPNFVADVQQAIGGLSHCVDKTLYFTFFSQFLCDFSLKSDHYSTDILEALQVMKSVFIDRQLCTLVTQQGIAQAWPQSSAEAIMSDLEDTGLIDATGAFLSDVTPDTFQSYCETRRLSPDYLNTVCTMQQYSHCLSDKELPFWSHKIHELCLRLDLQDLVDGIMDEDTCDEILMYAQELVRHYGKNTVSKFMNALSLNSKEKKGSAALLQELFKKCARKEWIFEVVIHQLKASLPLAVILDQLRSYDWESVYNKQRTTIDIIASITSQLTEDLSDKLKAKVNDIKTIETEDPPLEHFLLLVTPICEYTKEDIKEWAAVFRKSTTRYKQATLDHPLFEEAFAVIRRGVTLFYETEKHQKGVIPRDTQMVASLLFFQNLSMQHGASQGTRLMQQISTGEGKTLIICMTAIFKALLGEKVDIVTSSSVLATRDAADQKGLYGLFDISVSHCCHEELTKRRQAYESDVIYGDISSFQRDILETDFYGRQVRTAHAFDNVFIDEVDSMLVDKGETMLYLPHALPDLNALDHVYLEIWSLVNAQDFIGFPDEQEQLHDYLKLKLFGGLPANAFTAIPDINEEQSVDMHRHCIDIGLINPDDHCLTTKDSAVIQRQITTIVLMSPPSDSIPPAQLLQEMMMIIQQHLETIPLIQTIPKPLHPFVKKSFKSWIQSAVNAKYFRPNKEYIIDIDRRESAGDRYPRIIIMDNETGVEQESSEWGSGLHQFLQLKHHLRLSTESLKAVYMSNISFFTQRYTNIMGVTGTLGSIAEHTLFNKLYENTQLVVLPTDKPSRLQIDAPKCCSTMDSWEATIDADVQEKHDQGRAVLLICEDVERARHLSQHYEKKHPCLKHELYTSSHQEKLEETGDSEPGRLIIATNLAGRGTDLKLSDTVKRNGGLHVCLSYLPPNVRVEQQAYGRAARSGDPGSCKLIFHDEQGDLSYAIRKRDLCEAQRVTDIEADYYHNIRFQEELFEKFTTEYEVIKTKLEGNPNGRPELDYCLDCWAYFLDRYTDAIESTPNKLTNAARALEKERLRRAFDKEVKEKMVQMKLSPARLMQQGHTYMKQAVKQGDKYKDAGIKVNYERAIAAYRKAMAENPWDPFAKYYEAAAQLNHVFRNKNTTFSTGESDRRQLKQTFYQLIPLFQDKIKQCRTQISTLQLANRHQDHSLTMDAQYFDEQKQHEMEVYHQFIVSMQDIIGNEITPKIFDHADWGEKGAVVVFEIVKDMFPLKECRVSPRYPDRLKALLDAEESYHTYQSKIEKRIKSLMQVTKQHFEGVFPEPVTKQHFEGVFPDKHHLWDQLKVHRLITHETVPKKDRSTERVGYWNSSIDTDSIQFNKWDCIDADSFDWIHGLSLQDREDIVSHLKANDVLNQKGQLIEFNLSKPFNLPAAYTEHYKHIKDTLWIQSIYRFVLDHLRDCAVIDMTHDIDNSSSSDTALPDEVPAREPVLQASSHSVVDILISMNKTANASSSSDIQHIQVLSGKATPILQPTGLDINSFTMADHIPNETFNQEFIRQLHRHNLRVTNVSGDELNCMIHAMIQHAKQDYHIHCFEEADMIRKHLQQQYPEMSDMLHIDDCYAEAILNLVNDHCCATIKIRKVSVVIASSGGPIIYGGTCDKRFPSGRHVVIWQQGNHYVSIVHHRDMVQATSQRQVTDPSIPKASSMAVPKLTQHQLTALKGLGIIKQKETGNYEICAGLDTVELALRSKRSRVLSKQDKDQVRVFLRLKLEVDFKTLNRSPRQLLTNQHHTLYDDLCQHAVIKPVKMKKNVKDIEQVSYDRFGYKSGVHDRKPYFDVTVLNHFLRQKSIEELNEQERRDLVTKLQRRGIITEPSRKTFDFVANVILNKGTSSPTRRVDVKDDKLTSYHSDLLRSATSLNEKQQEGVKDYLQLMIHLKENVDAIISTLKGQQSTIRQLETPEISLRRLADVFDDSVQDKGDVLGWFSDNQCHLIIDLAEQKWSWKTISTAIGAIALGVAQIALGAVLLVVSAGTGAFFCSALISEGISDMMFGIEGLVKGHCNWSQYLENKMMSLAITMATAGVGALFARGREASKYSYKAFGNASKELMKETAEELGESAVRKLIAKQVAKEIGEKVAEAAVDAGINLATDAILDQLSQAIDSMSASIIDCFDTMCHDEELQEKMSTFLCQQDPQNAERYLHQITMRILQQRTFLDLWDDIENNAKKGTDVLTQAHGNATSHLNMRGEKLKGQRFMKGIGYVSRFAPLVTEALKGGMIKMKMEEVKTALKHDLEQRPVTNQGQTPLDETRIKEIKDKEIAAMKHHFSQEVSQRGKKIVTTGLQIVSQQLKKRTIEFAKERVVDPLKRHIDISQLNNYEQKLEAAKSDKNLSQIKKYEGKLQRLMACTRNPKVFSRMIEDHDALLGPAFAVPALEKLIGCPIRIVTEHGKALPNVQPHVAGDPIEVKFIPGKDGRPGHYYVGHEIFTPQEHGNNCLIHAVLKGAGRTDMDAGQVRKHIAEACRDSKHPCHDYIKRGIARNYVRIGVVGGGFVTYINGKFSGKAAWYPHMDAFLLNEWNANQENEERSKIDIRKWKQPRKPVTCRQAPVDRVASKHLGGWLQGVTLQTLGLNRCHRLSEKSIQEMVQHAISGSASHEERVSLLRLLRTNLLPTIEDVEAGRSLFESTASNKAFLQTYKGTQFGIKYMEQVKEVDDIIVNWGTNKVRTDRAVQLVKHLSNSPINVSLGHALTNSSIGQAMDYNPGTPRSEGIRKAFNDKPGFHPPKIHEDAYAKSLYTGEETTVEY